MNTFKLKSPDDRPGLTKLMEIVLSHFSCLEQCGKPVRLVVEGLLAHFFSPDRPSYVDEDVLYFLEMANVQDEGEADGLATSSPIEAELQHDIKKVYMHACASMIMPNFQ